jgi:hypothetical protein
VHRKQEIERQRGIDIVDVLGKEERCIWDNNFEKQLNAIRLSILGRREYVRGKRLGFKGG